MQFWVGNIWATTLQGSILCLWMESWVGQAKNNPIAIFSIEAKYMAISFAIVKSICLKRLLHKLGFCLGHCNQGNIGLMKNITHHRRTKHIDIWHHYFKETMNADEVVFEYCLMSHMGVDILMKSISQLKHSKCTKTLSFKKLEQVGV
jgi:hypothetical protein